VHYAKRGRLRFSSHRDFQRAFERALRRAAVPMAYSAGFSPHPKVSYAGAAPTGVASEAEYLEMGLASHCDPRWVQAALDAALPADLDVLDVVEVPPVPAHTKAPGLADRLEASVWEVLLVGVPPEAAERAAQAFLAAPAAQVTRLTKNGLRTFDARAAVVALTVSAERAGGPSVAQCAILRMVVRHVTPAVRPDDVLAGLRQIGDLAPPTTPTVVRLAQGPLDEPTGTVSDPLAPDRPPSEDAVGG
jgi:radical SAM-linked protein